MRQLWQAIASTSMDQFWKFLVNSISTLVKMICMSNDMHVQLSLYLTFTLFLNSCNGHNAFWCSFMLVKQSSSFSRKRKHRSLSLQICVRQTVRLTTEFGDWCTNVCTLHKHMSAVTSKLKHRLINTWESISQNVIDEAVGQWRKRLRASMRQKDITLNNCYTKTCSFQIQHATQPSLFRATNSLPRKTRCFAPFPLQPLKSK